MNKSRIVDGSVIEQVAVSRIPVRSISMAIVVTMVLYVGMLIITDWGAFSVSISAIPGVLWAQVVALSLLSYLLRFTRWHYFIVALGHRVPLFRNLEIYMAAFALTLTPGKAGEMIRSVYLKPYGVTYPKSIAAFFSERLWDLVTVLAIASLSTLLFPWQGILILSILISILIVFAFFRIRLLLFTKDYLLGLIGVGNIAITIDSIRYLLSGYRLVVAMPLSFMAWLIQGFSLYIIINALGYELPIIMVIVIYALSILTGVATFIPAGLGATEATIGLLLVSAGVAQADAVIASLICRGLTLWLCVGIGVSMMLKIVCTNKSI